MVTCSPQLCVGLVAQPSRLAHRYVARDHRLVVQVVMVSIVPAVRVRPHDPSPVAPARARPRVRDPERRPNGESAAIGREPPSQVSN